MLLFLGRNRSIYDRRKRSNLCESPGIAGGLPYNELLSKKSLSQTVRYEFIEVHGMRRGVFYSDREFSVEQAVRQIVAALSV